MQTKLERIAEISRNNTKAAFTSLYHLLNKELLLECHRELDGKKAIGIDGVSKADYEENLEENIDSLVTRLKNKAYKPMPSLRKYIPKGNGKVRPLGIACYEDKIVQLALKKIVEAVYEPKFLDCMYGFRPRRGCHDALKSLNRDIERGKVNYVLDADIRDFYDHLNHTWLMRFLKHRIADENLLRLIGRFLKSGVIENQEYHPTIEGAPQGGLC